MINLKIARIEHCQSIQWKYLCKVVTTFQRLNVYNIEQFDSFQSINNRHTRIYFDDDDINNADWESITLYLWEKISRQTKCQFIVDHELIVKICTHDLFAWILSDHVDNNSSSWSDVKKEWFNEKMREMWKKIANRLNKKSDHKCSEVKNISTKTKIQKITCSDLSLQIKLILSRCTISLRRDDLMYWVEYKS
jgi:hypothetical protein